MRVIPVLDLKGGRAVHAVGGDRAHYAPVRTYLHPGSDPIGLARAYRNVLGLRSLYLADLDAIAGAPPALPLYRELADLGLELWVDPGLRDDSIARPVLDTGVAGLIVGLETLQGVRSLAALVEVAGEDRLAFGLDLRAGRPIFAPEADWDTDDPGELAKVAMEMGISRVLLMDLDRIGTGIGFGTWGVASRLIADPLAPEVWVGGGVAGVDDLMDAAGSGIAVALVGSALLGGRIGRGEVEAFRNG